MKKYSYIAGVAIFLALLAWAFAPSSTGVPAVETALSAQADYFLKLDGIDGESSDKNHKNEIDIMSWSWGVSQTGTMSGGGGGGAGKAVAQDLVITKEVDKASPKLFLHTANGEHIRKAELFVRKAGGTQQDYYKVTLEDVFVSSYQTSGSGGNLPTEEVSFSYGKITMEYKQMSKTGTVLEVFRAGWDFVRNMVL